MKNALYDQDVIRQMEVEAEFFGEIEDRDALIKQLEGENAEQKSVIAEKDNALLKSVRMLTKAGFSTKEIAINLDLSEEEVRQYLEV